MMFSDLFRKTVSLLTLFAHIWVMTDTALADTLIAAQSQLSDQARCTKTKEICIDGPGTKKINGSEVYRDCWEYQDEFTCTEPDPADFCAPLKREEAKCEVQGQTCLENTNGECLRYTHQYSCDVDLKTLNQGNLPEHVQEQEHTHLISSNWDTSTCPDGCQVNRTKCIEPEETRTINGVSVTKSCWKEERQLECLTKQDKDECQTLAAKAGCQLQSSKCIHTIESSNTCQITEKVYRCTEPGTTKEVSSCVDRDFSKTITTMEMAREMQRHFDPDKQRFFNGEPNKCSVKLDGALDGVFGGDCCQTDADPGTMKDFVVQAGTSMAITYLMDSVASYYTYTVLSATVPNLVSTAVGAAGSVSAAFGGSGGVGAFGLSVGSTGASSIAVTFNPATFAIAVAIMALQQWLKCDQSEILTAMKRKAELCHYVGSYCGSKSFGACVTKMESQCCYVSKLAKLVNVGGRTQMGLGFGTPEEPICDGFTAQEMEKLDFSKLDLSEFYQEIYTNMETMTKQANHAVNKANSGIQNNANNVIKNYYE